MSKIYHIDDAALPEEYRRIVFESGHENVGLTVQEACAQKASLYKADLRGADLSGMVLRDGNFQCAVLSGANLDGCNLSGADFAMADLSAANLKNCILQSAKLNTVGRVDYVEMTGEYAFVNAGFGYPIFISDQVVNIDSLSPMRPEDVLLLTVEDAYREGGYRFGDNLLKIQACIRFFLGLPTEE